MHRRGIEGDGASPVEVLYTPNVGPARGPVAAPQGSSGGRVTKLHVSLQNLARAPGWA